MKTVTQYKFSSEERMLLRLASKMLDMAGDLYANHGCNDLPRDFFDEMSGEEKESLITAPRKGSGDPPYPRKLSQIQDFILMGYLADKMLEMAAAT